MRSSSGHGDHVVDVLLFARRETALSRRLPDIVYDQSVPSALEHRAEGRVPDAVGWDVDQSDLVSSCADRAAAVSNLDEGAVAGSFVWKFSRGGGRLSVFYLLSQ